MVKWRKKSCIEMKKINREEGISYIECYQFASINSLAVNVIERRWRKEGCVMKFIRFNGSNILNAFIKKDEFVHFRVNETAIGRSVLHWAQAVNNTKNEGNGSEWCSWFYTEQTYTIFFYSSYLGVCNLVSPAFKSCFNKCNNLPC